MQTTFTPEQLRDPDTAEKLMPTQVVKMPFVRNGKALIS